MHEDVGQRLGAGVTAGWVQHHLTVLLELLVNDALPRGQLTPEHALHLARELPQHLRLHAAQQERPQHLVQAVDDHQVLFHGQLARLCGAWWRRGDTRCQG